MTFPAPRFKIEDVITHWNGAAAVYDDSNKAKMNPHHWRFIEGIKHVEASNEQKKVLSIWSRTGDAIPYIRSKLPNAVIYNFEASPKMIEKALEKYPHEKFFQTDLNTIDLENESIDYIMSPETLEHVPVPEKLIAEFYRVLKADGKMVLSLPPRLADLHQHVYEMIVGGHGDGPRKGISSWQMKKILRTAGFNIDRHLAILLFPIGPVWFVELGNEILKSLPFLKELGIMQFYICSKRK